MPAIGSALADVTFGSSPSAPGLVDYTISVIPAKCPAAAGWPMDRGLSFRSVLADRTEPNRPLLATVSVVISIELPLR